MKKSIIWIVAAVLLAGVAVAAFVLTSDKSKPCKTEDIPVICYLDLHQLAEKGAVTYNTLADYCGDKNNADVYVATFNSNFAQMKFDGEKSHGKVFEVSESGVVTIWNHIASCLEEYKKYFLFHSTDVGYVNEFSQKNMGRTEMKGTGHLQHLYAMRCEKCGYEYHANGHDIFLKRCPNCQGGADTGK